MSLIEHMGSKMSRHAWDIQVQPNPFFSLGLHIDHRHPYITLHLPLVNIALGRIPVDSFAFQYSLRFGKQYDIVDGHWFDFGDELIAGSLAEYEELVDSEA